MDYSRLAKLYKNVESASKRLEKTKLISEFLKTVNDKELEHILLLLQGRVFAHWNKSNLGMSSKLAIKAISIATGKGEKFIEDRWVKLGDLGEVAAELTQKKTQSTLFSQTLSTQDVFSTLQKIATIEGAGSVETKTKLIAKLLNAGDGLCATYILRTVLEDLRVGIAKGTLRDSIVWAFLDAPVDDELEVTNREQYNQLVNLVQAALDKTNDFVVVAKAAKEGVAALERIEISVATPLQVMLAQKEASVKEALDRVGRPGQLEYKYDGFRLQVHKKDGKITLYTRRLENVTKQFPDVLAAVEKNVSGSSLIIDCEAVGYNPKSSKYVPFQHISQRIKRKYDIAEIAEKLPVELNVFDLLYLNGKSYIEEPLRVRRAALQGIIKESPPHIRLSTICVTSDDDEGSRFYQESLDAGNEGIMAKNLDGPYKPGARVGHMVKVKPIMETLDLIVVGAEWGEGKRSGWFTSFTLATRDEMGDLLSIGKVGTGFKELEQEGGVTFATMTELLKPHILEEHGKEVVLHPNLVIEVKFEEIQKSPSYSSGYALRFPRIVRIREDRGLSDISSVHEVEQGFVGQ